MLPGALYRVRLNYGSEALASMALGLAATPAPAQARDGCWGYPNTREQAWRRHEWRAHHYWHPRHYDQGYYAPHRHHAPRLTLGFNFR